MSHFPRTAAWLIGILGILWSCCHEAMGSGAPAPILNPKSYVSPGGEYELRVIPSTIHGAGAGTYVLKKGGEQVSSIQKPYTLWEAGVTDAGLVAGYAYSHGPRGLFLEGGGFEGGAGDFRVVVMDSTGHESVNAITRRQWSRSLNSPPDPVGQGMVMDQENDRLVVRVAKEGVDSHSESWWVYQLSTGKVLPRIEPKYGTSDPARAKWVITASPVAGTPLTLVHWWQHDGTLGGTGSGALFTLMDTTGQNVWHLDVPGDYEVAGDQKSEWQLQEKIGREGAILRADIPDRFDLHFVAADERVTFEVRQTRENSWTVEEIARAPYDEPKRPESDTLSITEIRLNALPPVLLETKNEDLSCPIRDIRYFAFDGKGRICFLRSGREDVPALALIDQDGSVAKEVSLHAINAGKRSMWSGLAYVGDDRYIVTQSPEGAGGKASAWWVNMTSETITPIMGFDCPRVQSIEAFPDGGFAVLTRIPCEHTWAATVYAFDATGRREWRLEEKDIQAAAYLFSPKDIAVTETGNVAVLDLIRKTIQIFDRKGQYLKVHKLQAAPDRRVSYPSAICAHGSEGFVIKDYIGKPLVIYVNADGTVRNDLVPRYPDGQTISPLVTVRVAPDGHVWTCDGDAFQRLSNDGIADRVLGLAPSPDRLDKIAGITIARDGMIYAVARRTGAVHILDAQGNWLRTCKPEPTDFKGEVFLPTLTVDDEGYVYLHSDNRARGRGYLRFSPEGKRVDFGEPPAEVSQLKWYSQPGTGRIWGLGRREVQLLDGSFQIIRTITKQPDGDWLVNLDDAAVAPNGAIAVVARDGLPSPDCSITVNLYNAEGDPVCTVPIPKQMGEIPRVAYDGTRLVVAGDDGLLCLRPGSVAAQRLIFGDVAGEGEFWYPYILAERKELVLFDANHQKPLLKRYEFP